MRWIAVLAVAGSLVVTACGSTTDVGPSSTTAPPTTAAVTTAQPLPVGTTTTPTSTSTTGSTASTTTSAPLTTTTSTHPPATTTASPHQPGDTLALLVAHEDGIDLWTPEQVTPILQEGSVDVALPDLAGGVIFTASEEGPPTVIQHIPQLDDEPEPLIADAAFRLVSPVQVTWVQGRRTLVYREVSRLPNDCPAEDEECAWMYDREYLHLFDLDTGVDENLGVIGSFESDYIDVRFGGEWAVVTFTPYGAPLSCSALVPAQQLFDTWLSPWPLPMEIGPSGGEERICPPEHSVASVAPDGSSWLQAIGDWELAQPWVVVTYATDSGAELQSTPLPDGFSPSWWDYDGTYAVVGDWWPSASPPDSASIFLVDANGSITELALQGRVTIWRDS